uniref:Solute carrier family 35 member B1 n=1 Tax=Plectus sambesii TaxID=2011161 RepID=A0A914UKS6_9BILA
MASARHRSADSKMPMDRNESSVSGNGRVAATVHEKMNAKGHGEVARGHEGGSTLKNALNLMFCAGGILICYFYFGLAQESITKSRYGEKKEKFVYTQALVFIQCVINAIFALIMMRVQKQGHDNTPWYLYALCAFSYLAAMITSNHSLQFVAYPTQVAFVCMIVAGVAMFLYKDGETKSPTQHFSIGFGEILLLISLAMDGTTGAIQERIRAAFHFKSHNMMLRMNVWSTIYLLVGLVATGELFGFVDFIQQYPYVLANMFGLSVASALGQYFIFKTVSDFGPLPCSIITTTRKLFTILASVILFQNPMTSRQWYGTLIVFIGLGLDGAFGKTKNTKPGQKDGTKI